LVPVQQRQTPYLRVEEADSILLYQLASAEHRRELKLRDKEVEFNSIDLTGVIVVEPERRVVRTLVSLALAMLAMFL
jgi:hypothetical protein